MISVMSLCPSMTKALRCSSCARFHRRSSRAGAGVGAGVGVCRARGTEEEEEAAEAEALSRAGRGAAASENSKRAAGRMTRTSFFMRVFRFVFIESSAGRRIIKSLLQLCRLRAQELEGAGDAVLQALARGEP